MSCDRCDELLAAYGRSLSLYRNVLQRYPGALGDDSKVVVFELDLVRQKTQEAREALMAHFRQDHGDLAKGADHS